MSTPRPDYMQLAKLRLDWARQRIDEFVAMLDDFLARQPFEVVSTIERKPGFIITMYRLKVNEQPPDTLSFAAGDAIHNLRAVLDNLVWGTGQVFGSKSGLALEFHSASDKRYGGYLKQLSKLPDPIREWIEDIQPYRRKSASTIAPSWLPTLNLLWNRDKHRSPLLMASAVPGARFDTVELNRMPRPYRLDTLNFGAMVDGTPILRVTFPEDTETNFNPKFALDVAFDKQRASDGQIVRHFLIEIHDYIATQVFPTFELSL